MTGTEWFVAALHFAALPLGLGLLGFIEPCSVGSSMLFIKHLEGRYRPACCSPASACGRSC
jgi:hypothetical protein